MDLRYQQPNRCNMDMEYQYQHQQPHNNIQISGNSRNQGRTVPHDQHQHQQIASLNTMISALQQSVKELTSIVAEQQGELCDTKARLSESESTIHTLRGRITKLETGFLEIAGGCIGGGSLRENKNSHKRKRQRNENDKLDDENNDDDDDRRAISPLPRKKAEIVCAPGAPSSSSASSEVSSATSLLPQAVATVTPVTRKKTCAATVTTRTSHKLPVTYLSAKAVEGFLLNYRFPKVLLDLCHNTGILMHARCLSKFVEPVVLSSGQEQVVVVRTSCGAFETHRSVTITEMRLPQLHPMRKFASPLTARIFDAEACKYDVILGGDFLRQKEIKVDLSSNSICWLGEAMRMDGFEFFEPKTATTSSPS